MKTRSILQSISSNNAYKRLGFNLTPRQLNVVSPLPLVRYDAFDSDSLPFMYNRNADFVY